MWLQFQEWLNHGPTCKKCKRLCFTCRPDSHPMWRQFQETANYSSRPAGCGGIVSNNRSSAALGSNLSDRAGGDAYGAIRRASTREEEWEADLAMQQGIRADIVLAPLITEFRNIYWGEVVRARCGPNLKATLIQMARNSTAESMFNTSVLNAYDAGLCIAWILRCGDHGMGLNNDEKDIFRLWVEFALASRGVRLNDTRDGPLVLDRPQRGCHG